MEHLLGAKTVPGIFSPHPNIPQTNCKGWPFRRAKKRGWKIVEP